MLGALVGLLSAACGGRSTSEVAPGVSASAGTANAGGGSSSSGAAGSAGDAATSGGSCSTPPACGGDLVGNWNVTSSCLVISGQLDLSNQGLGCATADVSGYRQVKGNWIGNADGTYVDATATSGFDQIELGAACPRVSGTPIPCDAVSPFFTALGYKSATCEDSPEGGCACWAEALFGVIPTGVVTHGNFSTSGNVVTFDGGSPHSYCVARNILTWTPQTVTPKIAGSVRFERFD